MTRKKTPNVLGDLMGEESEGRQQTVKSPKRQDSKAVKRQTAKTLRDRLTSESKDKATLYLSPQTAYDLELAKLELRRLINPENLKDVTKSSITEAALVLALGDLETRGNDSAIVAELEKAVKR